MKDAELVMDLFENTEPQFQSGEYVPANLEWGRHAIGYP
jgi:biotin operon repressor